MADYRKLEIKVCSAQNLKNVNFLSKMDPYVVVSISCDPAKHKTPVDRIGNKNPTWNSTIKFAVDVMAAQKVRPMLVFSILCERALGDKPIGEVQVPLRDLLGSVEDGKLCHVSYQVRKPSGRAKGELNFSYQWREKLSGASPPPTAPPMWPGKVEETVTSHHSVEGTSSGTYHVGKVEEPVTAYPVAGGSSAGYYPPVPGYVSYGPYHNPLHGGYQYQYPPVAGYGNGGYPPHQYSGYPPLSGPSYGTHGQTGYAYPPVRPVPKKNNSSGLFGLGAGLLGGLLVGDLLFD